jgi:hypothetical protein
LRLLASGTPPAYRLGCFVMSVLSGKRQLLHF